MKASSVSAFLELARWRNALLAAAGVLVGAWWVDWADPLAVLFAAASAIAFTVAANALNDAYDADLDRLAHPGRPIPSGRVERAVAVRIGRMALVVAVVLAAGTGIVGLTLLSCGVAVAIACYSPLLKPAGLPGNVAVALLASLPFLYGAWAAGDPRGAIALVAIAAPLHFARELAKDLDDVAGDAGRRRTVPLRWGRRATLAALLVALLAFAMQIVLVARTWPLLPALGIGAALACAGFAAARSLRGEGGAPRAFKAAMLLSMAAFVFSRARS